MQQYEISGTKIVIGTIPTPINCTGVSIMANRTIFWFANDDMVQANIDAIDAALAIHVWGEFDMVRSGNDYTITIRTDELSITPIIGGVVQAPINTVNGVATIVVNSAEPFTFNVLELDTQEVIYGS